MKNNVHIFYVPPPSLGTISWSVDLPAERFGPQDHVVKIPIIKVQKGFKKIENVNPEKIK